MEDKILLQEFTEKAAVVRIRANSIANKLAMFLADEIKKGSKIVAINASDLDVEKIHLQTLYNALTKNGIEKKRGVSFVVDNLDAKYISRVVVKL